MAKDKTSKTARVMNLLSKKPDPAAASETPEAAAPVAPAVPAAPPIVASMGPDAAVSAQIKNALEGALERELGMDAPEEPEAVTAEEARIGGSEAVDGPAAQDEAGEPEDFAELEAPAGPGAPSPWTEHLIPGNPGYINVMQILVEEKAPKYVKMFGLCTCERCMGDVKAYTLNHLAPKYVVIEPGDRVPRLTVYEGKFASDITAQLLQACKLVMERPHHGR